MAFFAFVAAAHAQAPIPQHTVRTAVDSGIVSNAGPGAATVFMAVIEDRGAAWVRLNFSDLLLSGDPHAADRSFLRITSLQDGAEQVLDATHARYWSGTTAYFNGDAVMLELVAFPGTGDNRVSVREFWAGDPTAGPVIDSLCGADNRIPSQDQRQGRLMPIGCTAWLIGDAAHCFITAGHCFPTASTTAVVQFNVPLSNANGSTVNPPPADQFPVQSLSVQTTGGGAIGSDAAYFGTNVNTLNQTAFQRQGVFYNLAASASTSAGQPITITGYGTTSSPISPTWNQVQKTHTGPFVLKSGTRITYQVDTTGGNSGSPVEDTTTGLAIGIHTHAGCSATNGNQGTAIEFATLQNYLANPRGVCIPPVPPACYPDCNEDSALNLSDFGCFQTKFATGDPYADCNADGVRNLADFGCFSTKFALGCP
ncbi:MAG: trypsin-like peptidase domain-containing protein [Phycisphaerales bacterium]|nr:trypsin-like peptidase domain-containing protein [Phycisphaerales bacterium]